MSAKLPYDAEVEYLESTGTQWIETGITINSHTAIEIRTARTDTTGYSYPSSFLEYVYDQDGVRFAAQMSVALNGVNYPRFIIAEKNAQFLRTGYGAEFHSYRIEQNGTSIRADIDGIETWANTSTHAEWSSSDTVILFGEKYNRAARSLAKARIAFFKLTKDGAVAFDAIPVRVGRVGYMYDRVSGQLFGNSGTGAFVLGPDVRLVNQPKFLLGEKTEVKGWVNPYITDGLVAMWDGEWNVGGGLPHDPSASVWKDICGNYDATFNGDMTNVTWNDKSVTVGGASLYFGTETYIPCVQVDDVYTAELVFSGAQTGADTTILGLPCSSNGGFGLVRGQLWGSMIVRAMYDTNPGSFGVTIPGTNYSSVIHAANVSDGSVKKLMTMFGGSSLESSASVSRNYSLIGAHVSIVGGGDGRTTARTVYCARIYNRVLTAAEIAANYAVDQRRFSL